MYHFTATENTPETIVLDEYNEISGYAIRYLKEFQISAVRFLFKNFCKRKFCILNDESGLGKTVTLGVFLGAVAVRKNCLIVVDNSDDFVTSWMFHLDVLTDLKTQILSEQKDYESRSCKVYIVKWNTLRTIVDLNKMKFDLIILDNRGQILNNTFCMSTLLKGFEKKVQIVISSVDITSDVKLLHNILRLGGRLDHSLENFKAFEEKFKLPDLKEISNKKSDLEDYFLKREKLVNYCRHFRLRRYRHQIENFLPLVDEERFQIFLREWKENSKAAVKEDKPVANSQSVPSDINTEEFLREFLQQNDASGVESQTMTASMPNGESSNHQRKQRQGSIISAIDVTDDQMDMSPLIFDTDSEDEMDVVFVSSETRDDGKNVVIEIDCTETIDVESSVGSDNGVIDDRTSPKNTENVSEIRSSEKELETSEKNPAKRSQSKEKKILEEDKNSIDNMPRHQLRSPGKMLENSKKNLEKGKQLKQKKTLKEDVLEIRTPDKELETAETNPAERSQSKEKKILEDDKNSIDNMPRHQLRSPGKMLENSKKNLEKGKQPKKKSLDEDSNSIDSMPRQTRAMERQNMETLKRGNLRRNTNALPQKNVVSKKAAKKPDSKENKKPIEVKIEKPTPTKNRTETMPSRDNESSVNEDTMKKTPEAKKQTPKTPEIVIERKICDSPATTRITRATPTTEQVKTRTSTRKNPRKAKSPHKIEQRETRNMQRRTRSAGGNQKHFALEYEKDKKTKVKKPQAKKFDGSKSPKMPPKQNNEIMDTLKEQPSPSSKELNRKSKMSNSKLAKKSESTATTQPPPPPPPPLPTTIKTTNLSSNQTETNINSTQTSILPTSSEYEEIQCGQKLQFDTSSENSPHPLEKPSEFLMPATPLTLRSISQMPAYKHQATPRPVFLDSECDIAVLPSSSTFSHSAGKSIVVLSSSQDEASSSSRASSEKQTQQKRKRYSKRTSGLHDSNIRKSSKNKTTNSFGNLLGPQRNKTKSPDLFSTCSSNNNVIALTQQNRRTLPTRNPSPFGFKIFGSEVRSTTQSQTSSIDHTISRTSRSSRSCLNILEEMFEKDTAKNHKKPNIKNGKRPLNNANLEDNAHATTSSKATIVPRKPIHISLNEQSNESEDIFEITKNTTFSNTLRFNSNGNISPVQLLTASQHHNKITNYLIGSSGNGSARATINGIDEQQIFGTPVKRIQQQQQQGSGGANGGTARKSPKFSKSTQNTKLTKWFRRSSIDEPTIRSQTSRPKDSKDTKPFKRRRLDLSFQN